MDNMKSIYMKVGDNQEELKNMVIDNYLEFENNVKYEFRRCEDCNGPMIGYLTAKCPKVEYSEDDVKRFERYIKNIGGFKEAVWARDKRLREEEQKIRAKELTEAKALLNENKVIPEVAGAEGGTTQLVKTRQPLLWSGQQFDRC